MDYTTLYFQKCWIPKMIKYKVSLEDPKMVKSLENSGKMYSFF